MESLNINAQSLMAMAIGIALAYFIIKLLNERKSKKQPQHRGQPFRQFKPQGSSYGQAGAEGELLFKKHLETLKGKKINNYMTTPNMMINGKNFEIDFRVLVPKVGIVMVEVKYYAGQVKCIKGQDWLQTKANGNTETRKNASKQALRTRHLMVSALKEQNLNKWPIIPVVVFTHPTATILRAKGDLLPETDIIRMEMFSSWLDKQPRKSNIKFTKEDNDRIKQALSTHVKEYEAA